MAEKILALVLAGGHGSHLHPLTLNHAKPSVAFCCYRLVDFTLSNLVNSGIESIYLLAQYKPESLIEHIHANWTFAHNDEERFISVVVPSPEKGECFYGTADAVAQNLELIEHHAPDLVAVFAADQIYRMDVQQMVAYHRECNAEVTVATTAFPQEMASAFGIVEEDGQGRVKGFAEQPWQATANTGYARVSMGDYLFNTEALIEGLDQMMQNGECDFGRHVLPRMVSSHRVYAYDFDHNTVPGIQSSEEPAYWRDIGTLEAYIDALLDVDGHAPRFNLHNDHWPVLPVLSAQRPLFGASYMQLVASQRRRSHKQLSYTILS